MTLKRYSVDLYICLIPALSCLYMMLFYSQRWIILVLIYAVIMRYRLDNYFSRLKMHKNRQFITELLFLGLIKRLFNSPPLVSTATASMPSNGASIRLIVNTVRMITWQFFILDTLIQQGRPTTIVHTLIMPLRLKNQWY